MKRVTLLLPFLFILNCYSNELIKKEFKSETELLDFFNENITKKDFFINETELTRK